MRGSARLGYHLADEWAIDIAGGAECPFGLVTFPIATNLCQL
jgi:hypothetical protein